MKILKKILLVIGVLLAIWLIAAAFIDGNCQLQKSVSINATPDLVWTETNSLKAIDNWSPWNKLDPNMKKEWTGTTGEIGEKVCWEGNEDAGKGCQELVKIDSVARKIDTQVKFLTPYESEADFSVSIMPVGNTSRATWSFTSNIPFPFSPMKLFFSLEDSMGKDFEEGLQNLKNRSERH